MSDEARFQKAIQQLNEVREQKGVDYNGKLYSTVKDRVEEFRKLFGSEFGIDTTVDYRQGFGNGSVVVANAKIVDKTTGTILASGHAMNHFGSDSVNTTSIVEVTETNAIGRALATFGLHGGEFAS